MMRKLALVPLMILAACSEEKSQPGGSEATQTALKLQPGQWEMTTEISGMTMAYKDAPAPMKAGTKVTTSSCIADDQVDQPQATLFAGSKDTCKYDNFYMARGRINASMSCKQPGVPGNMLMNIDGKYTADTMDVSVDMATYMGTPGDMRMTSKMTGRRLGPCVPEGEPKQG